MDLPGTLQVGSKFVKPISWEIELLKATRSSFLTYQLNMTDEFYIVEAGFPIHSAIIEETGKDVSSSTALGFKCSNELYRWSNSIKLQNSTNIWIVDHAQKLNDHKHELLTVHKLD